MKDRILNCLCSFPGHTAAQVAHALCEDLKTVGARMSAMHKDGDLTAESIWITVRPAIRQPVLHYSVKVTK